MQFNNYEFENLTKDINKNINVYKLDLEILNNLKFLKKKDGTDFKDLKKSFDIEGLKEHFKNQGLMWLYLDDRESFYRVNVRIGDLEGFISFDKDIREDEMTPEEKEKNADRIIRGTWRVPYMLINSTDELIKQVEKKKALYTQFIQREAVALSQLDDLKKITVDYIKKYNETCQNEFKDYHAPSFYSSTIQKLFTD